MPRNGIIRCANKPQPLCNIKGLEYMDRDSYGRISIRMDCYTFQPTQLRSLTCLNMNMDEMVHDYGETFDPSLIISDEDLVERVEQLAWEKDMDQIDIAIACCWYGLRHHEKALTTR